MEPKETGKKTESSSANKPKKSLLRRSRPSPKVMKIAAVAVCVIAVLAGVFFAGERLGAKHQKSEDAKAGFVGRRPLPASAQNRWVLAGTIQQVSANSVKIKDTRGQVKDAAINSSTSIVDKSAKKAKASDLKENQRIIASGTKDAKGNYTATRIRIE